MTDLRRLAATMAGDPECPAHYARSVAEAAAEVEALRAALQLARENIDPLAEPDDVAIIDAALAPNAALSRRGAGQQEEPGEGPRSA